jgi:hypothetical protein
MFFIFLASHPVSSLHRRAVQITEDNDKQKINSRRVVVASF